MRGLSFVVAAVISAHASADAMDNTLYYVADQPTAYAAPPLATRYVTEPHYVRAEPYASTHYLPTYERSFPVGGRYIEVPEPHETAIIEAADPAVRYVKVPETLYEKFIAGEVHHEAPVAKKEKAAKVAAAKDHTEHSRAHPVTVHHDGQAAHDVLTGDYAKHYNPHYYVDPRGTHIPVELKKKTHHAKAKAHANSEATEGHHEPVKHHAAPEAHHKEKERDALHITHVIDDHNVEDMDLHHHTDLHHAALHHDLPLETGLHDIEHLALHHDTDIHETIHEMEHGHHDSHYDSEHFYDSPLHHGGLHGEYLDPMAAEGHHSYYEDEEHVAHFTHHSEEPLTHTEEYYYGAPIHHYHHDYHHTDVAHSCWKKVAGRTAGEPLSSCPENKEKDGALCYDYCKDGYSGVGPVCWQNCPHDKEFRDDGAYCYKPDAYGRGAGEIHNCGPNCEKWGDFWYIKCHPGFHNVGCCVCSPDCPDGMVDIGISCAKNTYSREVGKQL